MCDCKAEVKEEQEEETEEETEMGEETQKVYVKVGGVNILVGQGTMKRLERNRNPPQREQREKARLATARSREQRKKEETPEEKEERLRRQREWKRKSLAKETPEKREEKKRRRKELAEKRRRLRAEGAPERREKVRDEKAEERHRRILEQQRARRRNETPEAAAERRRKNAEINRRRREEERRLLEKEPETEEEKKKREEIEEKRRQEEFNKLVKKATMTEEEMEAMRMKKFLYKQAWEARRGRWRDQPEEVKEKARRQNREWVARLEGERKERWKESTRRATKKYIERLKNEGNWEKCPQSPEYQKMRLERMKAKGTWERMKERAKEYQRRRYATETPEERERRKWKEKVNGARRRLKKQLEEKGMQVEEITRRDEELKVQMWREFDPDIDLTQKKPRGRKPREETKDGPAKVNETKDRGREQRNQQEDLSPPKHHQVSPISFSLSSTFLQNKEIQPCTATGGINEDVIEGDDDQFSPPPSPDAPSSPALTRPECQEVPDPQPCQTSNFAKEVSPPPIRSRNTVHCSHCPLEFCTESQLRSHIVGCHPSKCWKCPKCQEVVLSPLELSHHYNSVHKVSKEGPPPPSPLKKEVYKFTCISCSSDLSHGNQFKMRLELFSHVKLKHRESFWPCKHCNLLKYSQKSLDLHLQICGCPKK